VLLDTYELLGAQDLEQEGRSSRMVSPLAYQDQSLALSDHIHHGGLPCSYGEADVRRPASTIGDGIEVLYWRTDDDRLMPPARRLDENGADGFENPSRFRRKGVQVLYSAHALTVMRPCEEGPAKKATRKARWPYMGKY
jgi:hypothetical protein